MRLNRKIWFESFLFLILITPINLFCQKAISNNIIDSNKTHEVSIEEDEIQQRNFAKSERIYYEIIVSPLAGGIVAIPSGLISLAIAEAVGYSDRYPWGYTAIGGLIGYSVGNAFIVYLFEKNGIRDVGFTNTLLASLIGSAMSVGVLELTGGDLWNNNVGMIAIISLPAIASIIYANFLAPEIKQENTSNKVMTKNQYAKSGFTHKDYFNSKKLFDLELFRMKF